MTTMPMKIEDNLNVDEVRFASVSYEDLRVFLNRYFALRVNVDDRMKELHCHEVSPGLVFIGSCVLGDNRQIDQYSVRIPEYYDTSVNNTARYGYMFAYNGVVYSLDYDQHIQFHRLCTTPDDVKELSDDELWIEFMEFLNDYYPSES